MTQELTNAVGGKLCLSGTLSIDASGAHCEKVRITAHNPSGQSVAIGSFYPRELIDAIRAEVSKSADFVSAEAKSRIEDLEARLKKADEAIALKDENIERLSAVMRRQEAEPKTIEDYLNAIRELAKTPEYQTDSIEQGMPYVRIAATGKVISGIAHHRLKVQTHVDHSTLVPQRPKQKASWEDAEVIEASTEDGKGRRRLWRVEDDVPGAPLRWINGTGDVYETGALIDPVPMIVQKR